MEAIDICLKFIRMPLPAHGFKAWLRNPLQTYMCSFVEGAMQCLQNNTIFYLVPIARAFNWQLTFGRCVGNSQLLKVFKFLHHKSYQYIQIHLCILGSFGCAKFQKGRLWCKMQSRWAVHLCARRSGWPLQEPTSEARWMVENLSMAIQIMWLIICGASFMDNLTQSIFAQYGFIFWIIHKFSQYW